MNQNTLVQILAAKRTNVAPSRFSAHPDFQPKWPNMAPSWHQNGSKNQPKMGYPIGPGGPKWGTPSDRGAKKSKENTNARKKRVDPHRGPPLEPKKSPTRPQLGSQNGAKMAQKSMQKCIIFLMPLGIDLWVDFGGFWVPKSSQVGTRMGSKIDVNSERRLFKK